MLPISISPFWSIVVVTIILHGCDAEGSPTRFCSISSTCVSYLLPHSDICEPCEFFVVDRNECEGRLEDGSEFLCTGSVRALEGCGDLKVRRKNIRKDGALAQIVIMWISNSDQIKECHPTQEISGVP